MMMMMTVMMLLTKAQADKLTNSQLVYEPTAWKNSTMKIPVMKCIKISDICLMKNISHYLIHICLMKIYWCRVRVCDCADPHENHMKILYMMYKSMIWLTYIYLKYWKYHMKYALWNMLQYIWCRVRVCDCVDPHENP